MSVMAAMSRAAVKAAMCRPTSASRRRGLFGGAAGSAGGWHGSSRRLELLREAGQARPDIDVEATAVEFLALLDGLAQAAADQPGGDARRAVAASGCSGPAAAGWTTPAQSSDTTGFRSSPMPWMLTETVSPGVSSLTPAGVPVRMMSPGSSVMTCET